MKSVCFLAPMRPFLPLLKGEEHCTLYITVPCASTAPTRQFHSASHLEGRELSDLFNPIQLKMSMVPHTATASVAACGNCNRFLERRFPVVQISTGHKVHANSLQPVRLDRGFIIIVFQWCGYQISLKVNTKQCLHCSLQRHLVFLHKDRMFCADPPEQVVQDRGSNGGT